MNRIVAVGFALLFAACGDDPAGPEVDRVPFDPPGLYARLWDEVESCSGRSRARTGVRWFLTPGFADPGVLGQWNPDREITLRVDVWNDRLVVQHEILHDLLRGDGAHRDPAWTACGIPRGVDP